MTLTTADLDRIQAKLRDATAHHSDASWAEIKETIRLARIGLWLEKRCDWNGFAEDIMSEYIAELEQKRRDDDPDAR